MKAIILNENSKAGIENVPKPEIEAEDEVLVKIHATAVNHRDLYITQGLYPGIRPNIILGSDASGEVVAAGSSAQKYLNKRVILNPNIDWGNDEFVQSKEYKILGMPEHGTFAEYIKIKMDRVHVIPEHLDYNLAAAMPLAGLTAWHALVTHGKLSPQMKVLISGIGGGVAQMAMLFALANGNRVFCTSSQDEKLKTANELGAIGINYKNPEWDKVLLDQYGPLDLIIDSAGGNSFNQYINILKPGGSLVFYGATTGLPSKLNLHKIFWKQLRIQGSTMGSDADFAAMLQFTAENSIQPLVDGVYSFEKFEEAFKKMEDGQQFGKLILSWNK